MVNTKWNRRQPLEQPNWRIICYANRCIGIKFDSFWLLRSACKQGNRFKNIWMRSIYINHSFLHYSTNLRKSRQMDILLAAVVCYAAFAGSSDLRDPVLFLALQLCWRVNVSICRYLWFFNIPFSQSTRLFVIF